MDATNATNVSVTAGLDKRWEQKGTVKESDAKGQKDSKIGDMTSFRGSTTSAKGFDGSAC
jgi:hypothetical protein